MKLILNNEFIVLKKVKYILFILLLLFLCNCTTPISTMQRAKTPGKGNFEAHLGMGVPIASTTIGGLVDTAEIAVDKADEIYKDDNKEFTDEEIKDISRAALSNFLLGPGANIEIGVKYGLTDWMDLGLEYGSSVWRFDTKIQLMDKKLRDNPFDLSIGVGYQSAAFEIPIPSLVKKVLKIEDLKRSDYISHLLMGNEINENFYYYSGLTYVFTKLDIGVVEKFKDDKGLKTNLNEDMHFMGAVGGIGAGYKYVYLVAELNALYYTYNPVVNKTEIGLNGVLLYPAVYLDIRFY